MATYVIHRLLGTDGDGLPEWDTAEFWAESEEKAIYKYEQEKTYYDKFKGFLSVQISKTIRVDD